LKRGRPKKIIDAIKEKLSFRELVELVKGSHDIEKRASVILAPKTPETSTNLSANQVEFVSIAMSITQTWPEFQGLEDYAKEFLLASTSKEGWGVDRMIAHEQAISEKRMMQLGLRPQGEGGKQVEQSKS
jgi:hypothetical protein